MSAGKPLSPEQIARLVAVARENPELGLAVLAARFSISACAVRKRLREAGVYVRKDGHGNIVEASS